eukprot:10390412-Prorocentrum_lima.AAC.1
MHCATRSADCLQSCGDTCEQPFEDFAFVEMDRSDSSSIQVQCSCSLRIASKNYMLFSLCKFAGFAAVS